MPVRVALAYNFVSDFDFLENSEELEIVNIYNNPLIQQPDELFAMYKQMDLVIFLWDAHFMRQMFEQNSSLKNFREFFLSKSVRKVWWTLDSHHLWRQELPFQKYFDHIYIAHSNFLSKFEKETVRLLPGFFESCSIQDLIELTARKVEKTVDVSMVYGNYSYIGDRNFIIWKIREVLERKKINYYLGTVRRKLPYLQMLKSCRVGLSVSLSGSNVDQRFFEVLGLNGVLLAEKIPAHKDMKMNLSHAHFFDRNLDDFENALELALSDHVTGVEDSWQVLNNHMQFHRYIELINRELGTNFRVAPVPRWILNNSLKKSMEVEKFFFSPDDQKYSGVIVSWKAILTCIVSAKFKEAFTILDSIQYIAISGTDIGQVRALFLDVYQHLINFLRSSQNELWAWSFLALLYEHKGKVKPLFEEVLPENNSAMENEIDTTFLVRVHTLIRKKIIDGLPEAQPSSEIVTL